MMTAAVRFLNVCKSFFSTQVLHDVCIEVASGRTLGLVGENGAGKSTLMNLLGGNLVTDSGSMELDGEPYRPSSPRDATAAGVAFIHQELNLFANLSIAENLFLDRFPTKLGRIKRSEVRRRANELLRQVGLHVSPSTPVEALSTGQRQLVEIARALDLDARVIILDEPTTSLTQKEKDRLFELLRQLQERGIAMIYISHALEDVLALCHDVAVLRDGRLIEQKPVGNFDIARMISLMVGRESVSLFPQRTPVLPDVSPEEPLLDVQAISRIGVIDDVTFQVRRGEIVGLAGLMGSGRTELARILFGLDSAASGHIELAGRQIEGLSTRRRIDLGMAMLTESRRDDGLCMSASIAENLAMVASRRYASPLLGRLKRRELGHAIDTTRESVKLNKTAKLSQRVETLSGGNQQKVVLGKWLMNEPSLLILDEPTRGIDVGAKHEIYCLIDELAAGGDGVLMISSELDELLGVCDRILVLCRGRIVDDVSKNDFDEHRIMQSCFGVLEAASR